MASSDIIKIGFDYRSSLAQFEKDTNGVFNGISSKAGKQKITIQLDAKDDKVIDKIKELQKLKLDKFTFEFGNSGLKEQLQTFDKLENKINEIINLGKGKSIIDSSSIVKDIGKVEDAVSDMNKAFNSANVNGLKVQQEQINQNVDSLKKLLDLLYDLKNVNKSSYSGKHNTDWVGIYSSQEDAIKSDLNEKQNKLHSSLNLILSEDKNAISSLEAEANKLKDSLQSIQDLSNRISSNSSISKLGKNADGSFDYKSYANEYKLIDDRLGELNKEYELTNDQLEEYITLQVKADKIMEKVMNHSGGVKGSGAKNKSELRTWIEKSFAEDLNIDPNEIYNGLFGNITDSMYSSWNGISLFNTDGTKKNLRDISAEISGYKSVLNGMSGGFGAEEDYKRLKEINDILGYIKKNANDIQTTDFSQQIKQLTEEVDYYNQKISEGTSDDFYVKSLETAKKELADLLSLQDRLNTARNENNVQTNNTDKIVDNLKEQESQAIATAEAEKKLAKVKKETTSTNSSSDDSQIEELKSDIQEVKTELVDVKDRITSIESNGFENVREDVEKTKESVKELNSELVEMKSNLSSSTQAETNISSASTPAIEQQNKLQEELKETEIQSKKTAQAVKNVNFDNSLTDIKGLKHYTDEVFDSFDSSMFGQGIGENRLGEAAYFFDENDIGFWKDIGEHSKYLTTWSANQVKILDQTMGLTEEEIERIIKEFYSDVDKDMQEDFKFDLKNMFSDIDLYDFKSRFGIELKDISNLLGYDAVKSSNGEYAFYNTDKLIRETQVYDQEAQKIIEINNKVSQSIQENSSISSTNPLTKDAFLNADTKLDETVTSAKDLDKTLEQIDIPTDSFDKVLERLDRTKSELVDIVKITRKSVSDKDGKFHDSYTLKDSRGSTEIYGMSSKTDKGQILDQNIVKYDAKKDAVDNSKELLAIEKQLQKEIEASDKANQKRFQDFQKEQADYAESVNKVNSAIQKTDEILDTLPLHDKLDGQFLDMIDSVDNLNSKLKSGELTLSEYKNEVKSVTSEYSKMVSIQQKRDVEDYNANAKANLENAKSIKEEWTNALKTVKEYETAVSKLNNLKASDKGLETKTADIKAQQKKIDDMKSSFESAQATILSFFSSTDKFNSLPVSSIKEVQDAIKLIQTAVNGSTESVSRLEDALRNMQETSIGKLEKTLSNYQGKISGYKATIDKFGDDGWTSPEYSDNVQRAQQALKAYEDEVNKLKANPDLINKESLANVEKLGKDFEEATLAIKNMTAAQKGYTQLGAEKAMDKISQMLKENSKMSRQAKADIKAWYDQIKSGNPSASLDVILGKVEEIVRKEKEAGRGGKSMWDAIKEKAWYGAASAIGTYFGVNDIFRYIGDGISTIRDLDEAMTEVRKVSSATEAQYKSFQKTISSTAKEIASTNKELLNSSADFLRLGYSLDEASDLAKNATLFVNVGDGVDINAATEDMITAMKAFDIQAKDSIKIVDDYNQIGNMYALSATDIGEAMKRSASALETGNNSFEESIALITAMNEIVQNSENTGNTLKVFSLRLRGAKAELEDMGEDTDGLCDSTSKLREQLKSLTGVDIMLNDNTFKSTTQIVKELGATWDKLSDSSQAATLELVAGKTRANNVAALLKNYQQIDNVITDLGNAEGSAEKENAAIVDSINGRIKTLSATAEDFWQKFIDTDLVKDTISSLSGILNLLTKIIDKVGLLPTLLTPIGAIIGKKLGYASI